MYHINFDSFRRLIHKHPDDTVRACEWAALFETLIRAHNCLCHTVDGILRGEVRNIKIKQDIETFKGHPIDDFVLWSDLKQTKQEVTFRYPYTGTGYVIRSGNLCYIQLDVWSYAGNEINGDNNYGICGIPDDCIPEQGVYLVGIGVNTTAEPDADNERPRILYMYGKDTGVGDPNAPTKGTIALGNVNEQNLGAHECIRLSACYFIKDEHNQYEEDEY